MSTIPPVLPSPSQHLIPGLSVYNGVSLLGHWYSIQWKENLLLAATIVGVACCALAFFTAKIHLFVPFAFLTLASMIGAYVVQDADAKEKLTHFVTTHEQSLKAQIKTLTDVTERLEKGVGRVETAGDSLASTAASAQQSQEAIARLTKRLESVAEKFDQTHAGIEQSLAEAEARLLYPASNGSSSASTAWPTMQGLVVDTKA